MDKLTRQYIEKLLGDYPYLDSYIESRKRDIMTPYRETDTNIGGSSSGRYGDTTAQTAMAIASDKRIEKLEEMRYAIDKIMHNLDPMQQLIVEMRYFSDVEEPWSEIAYHCGYSERQCYNIRDAICEAVAKELGLTD